MKWKGCFIHPMWGLGECQHNGLSVSARNWTPLEPFPSYPWITHKLSGPSALCHRQGWWGENGGALGGNACPSSIPQHPEGLGLPCVRAVRESERWASICWPAPRIHKSDSMLLLKIGWPHCQLSCGWPVPGEQSDQVLVKIRCCFNERFLCD